MNSRAACLIGLGFGMGFVAAFLLIWAVLEPVVPVLR